MTRLFLFATPALFVVAMVGAYFANEVDHAEVAIVCVAVAIGSLIGWHAVAGWFELRAWRSGRGNRPL